MFCPACSQQQISDSVRFCPGCGFQLNFVRELLSNNGIPAGREPEVRKWSPLLQRQGIRNGAKLVFLSLFTLPIGIMISIYFDSPIPLLPPLSIFLLGFAFILYTLIFGEDKSEMPETGDAALSPTKRRFSLSAARGTPVPIIAAKPINTAEIVKPPSVTEHTTQLLNDDH